ncbi:hypothetical protein H6P81_017663 [Aristolochia fimbriata]|uniref:Pectinesterase inhibitor domain-containing protein n=1 Tax=Aristolochia fimbriata TaxID=158543 RepID=A0AAV7DZU0_ARIFI|nr:hypothetical protein H6P81_017663 [Aristolochia fimbriata]
MATFRIMLVAALVLIFHCDLSCAEDPDIGVFRDVCKKTDYPDLCFSTFSNNPDSRGKNFHDLTALFLSITARKGEETRNFISQLQKKTTDPLTQSCLRVCFDYYDVGVVEGSTMARESFNRNDYFEALSQISGCENVLFTCDEAFNGPPSRPNVLKQRNAVTRQYCSIALSLVYVFKQG